MNYRNIVLFIINLVVIIWLFYNTYFEKESTDFFGIFFFIAVILMLGYNVYAYFVKSFFINKESSFKNIFLYIIFLMIPFILLRLIAKL